jgi:hypothetical protein
VGHLAVAALSERCNSLTIRGRRSETAATEFKLTHYRPGHFAATNCACSYKTLNLFLCSPSVELRMRLIKTLSAIIPNLVRWSEQRL